MRRYDVKCICLMLLLLFTSCVRDVELILDPVPPRLVLNAAVSPDQEVEAFLSESWFLLDSIVPDRVPDATLRLYINDIFRGEMQCSDTPSDTVTPKGRYILPDCRVQEGDRLRLEAEAAGFDPIKAETQIPPSVEIGSLDTLRFISSTEYNSTRVLMRVNVGFRDRSGGRNYYRLILSQSAEHWKGDSVRWTSTQLADNYGYYPDYAYLYINYEDPVFYVTNSVSPTLENGRYSRGIFSNDLFNGQEYVLKTSLTPVVESYKGDSVTSIVHYDIYLLSISPDYYHYMNVLRNFSINIGDVFIDGLIEPSATYTNVTDGFGIVAGYQISRRRITMPFGTTAPLATPWGSMADGF